MAVTGDGTDRLPCGADIDALLAQVADLGAVPRTAHQHNCPHCQATLAEFDRLWGPVRQLVAEHITTPSGLLSAVMRRVREITSDVWHAVTPGDRGSTRIAAQVIATVARLAAGRVPGVWVALGRTTNPTAARAAETATRQQRYPGAAVGVAGTTAVVEIALATTYGQPIAAVAQHARREVIHDLQALTGIQAEVNITVDDIIAN